MAGRGLDGVGIADSGSEGRTRAYPSSPAGGSDGRSEGANIYAVVTAP